MNPQHESSLFYESNSDLFDISEEEEDLTLGTISNQYGYSGWSSECTLKLSTLEEPSWEDCSIRCMNAQHNVEENRQDSSDAVRERAQEHILKLVDSFKREVSVMQQEAVNNNGDYQESKRVESNKRYLQRLLRKKSSGRLDQRVSWADQKKPARQETSSLVRTG